MGFGPWGFKSLRPHRSAEAPRLVTIRVRGAVAQLAKAPVSKTGDSRFESWLPRCNSIRWFEENPQMRWLAGRSMWVLLVPVGIACAAVAEAIAVNRASGLLPSSWTWANGTVAAWLLVLATTLLTALLAWALRRAQLQESRRRDRRDLTLRTDIAFQATMGIHRPPSSRIRWTPRFDLFYSGTRVLTILDIVPTAPARKTDKGHSICFVRTAVSSSYKAYPTFGAVAKVQDESRDDFHYTEQWPLLVCPGQRMHVAVDQEFEIQLDGAAMSFEQASDGPAPDSDRVCRRRMGGRCSLPSHASGVDPRSAERGGSEGAERAG